MKRQQEVSIKIRHRNLLEICLEGRLKMKRQQVSTQLIYLERRYRLRNRRLISLVDLTQRHRHQHHSLEQKVLPINRSWIFSQQIKNNLQLQTLFLEQQVMPIKLSWIFSQKIRMKLQLQTLSLDQKVMPINLKEILLKLTLHQLKPIM